MHTAVTVTPRTRAAVDARDGGRCRRCGTNVRGREFSRHHRKPRKMGGANRADANRLSNIVTLCGSATTPGGCHQWVETHRDEAREAGWLLYDRDDPAEVGVLTVDGWRSFGDDGDVLTIRAGA